MSVFLLDEELWLPDPYLGDEDGLVAVGGAIVQSTPAQFELPFPAILPQRHSLYECLCVCKSWMLQANVQSLGTSCHA